MRPDKNPQRWKICLGKKRGLSDDFLENIIQSGNLRKIEKWVIIGVLIYIMKCYVSLLVQIMKRNRDVSSVVIVL